MLDPKTKEMEGKKVLSNLKDDEKTNVLDDLTFEIMEESHKDTGYIAPQLFRNVRDMAGEMEGRPRNPGSCYRESSTIIHKTIKNQVGTFQLCSCD